MPATQELIDAATKAIEDLRAANAAADAADEAAEAAITAAKEARDSKAKNAKELSAAAKTAEAEADKAREAADEAAIAEVAAVQALTDANAEPAPPAPAAALPVVAPAPDQAPGESRPPLAEQVGMDAAAGMDKLPDQPAEPPPPSPGTPINTMPGPLVAHESTNLFITGLAVALPEGVSSTVTTSLRIDHGILKIADAAGARVEGSDTGFVMLTGTPTEINTTLSAVNNVVYTPTPGFVGLDTLSMSSSNGIQSVTDTLDIAVMATPVEPPAKPADPNAEMKGWVRREIDLAMAGHSLLTRQAENP